MTIMHMEQEVRKITLPFCYIRFTVITLNVLLPIIFALLLF